MNPFKFYLKLGFEHISNLNGYDHILFLIVLCAVYRIQQWKKILILVTAFTIGHSITLALVSFDLFNISSGIIKFLIPTTIFITALNNVMGSNLKGEYANMSKNYAQFSLNLNGNFKNFSDGKFKKLSDSYEYVMKPWEYWILLN